MLELLDSDVDLVLLDLQIDTSTPAGHMMVTVLAALAEMERGLISQRTREAYRAVSLP